MIAWTVASPDATVHATTHATVGRSACSGTNRGGVNVVPWHVVPCRPVVRWGVWRSPLTGLPCLAQPPSRAAVRKDIFGRKACYVSQDR